jgi:hypothetical protein
LQKMFLLLLLFIPSYEMYPHMCPKSTRVCYASVNSSELLSYRTNMKRGPGRNPMSVHSCSSLRFASRRKVLFSVLSSLCLSWACRETCEGIRLLPCSSSLEFHTHLPSCAQPSAIWQLNESHKPFDTWCLC